MTNPKTKTKPYGQAFSKQLPSLTLAAFCKTHLTLMIDSYSSKETAYLSPEEVKRLTIEMGEWLKSTTVVSSGRTRLYGHRETVDGSTISVNTDKGYTVRIETLWKAIATTTFLDFADVSDLVTQLLDWLDKEVNKAENCND